MIGKKIGNYEVKSLLGEGGMGNVYLAVHTQLGRKVAIKSLHQQLVKNEGLRARFKQEANTMAHLQHNGIVSLFDFVEDENGLFLIMELVDGTPLDEYIKNVSGPIPAERAIPIMQCILEAFAYAHTEGVVHRDIKPANILLTKNGKVKILDFGIAKMLSDAGNKLTKAGTQMGTVFYMSPEQVQGKEVDQRSDIYSLGITFYQMLTGVTPYEGMTTEYEVYNKIVMEPLPFASSYYPNVPTKLDEVILKATAKKLEDRYQNCDEFLDQIVAFGIKDGWNFSIEKEHIKSTELSNLPEASIKNNSDQAIETDDLQTEVEKSEKLESAIGNGLNQIEEISEVNSSDSKEEASNLISGELDRIDLKELDTPLNKKGSILVKYKYYVLSAAALFLIVFIFIFKSQGQNADLESKRILDSINSSNTALVIKRVSDSLINAHNSTISNTPSQSSSVDPNSSKVNNQEQVNANSKRTTNNNENNAIANAEKKKERLRKEGIQNRIHDLQKKLEAGNISLTQEHNRMREIQGVKLRLPKKREMQIAAQNDVIQQWEKYVNSLMNSISQLQSQL